MSTPIDVDSDNEFAAVERPPLGEDLNREPQYPPQQQQQQPRIIVHSNILLTPAKKPTKRRGEEIPSDEIPPSPPKQTRNKDRSNVKAMKPWRSRPTNARPPTPEPVTGEMEMPLPDFIKTNLDLNEFLPTDNQLKFKAIAGLTKQLSTFITNEFTEDATSPEFALLNGKLMHLLTYTQSILEDSTATKDAKEWLVAKIKEAMTELVEDAQSNANEQPRIPFTEFDIDKLNKMSGIRKLKTIQGWLDEISESPDIIPRDFIEPRLKLLLEPLKQLRLRPKQQIAERDTAIDMINNFLGMIEVAKQSDIPFPYIDVNLLHRLNIEQQLDIILKWVRELSEADESVPHTIIKSKLKELLHYVQDLPAPSEKVIPIVEEIEPLLDLIDESREQQPMEQQPDQQQLQAQAQAQQQAQQQLQAQLQAQQQAQQLQAIQAQQQQQQAQAIHAQLQAQQQAQQQQAQQAQQQQAIQAQAQQAQQQQAIQAQAQQAQQQQAIQAQAQQAQQAQAQQAQQQQAIQSQQAQQQQAIQSQQAQQQQAQAQQAQQPFSHMDPNSLAHLQPKQQLAAIDKWVLKISEGNDTIPADIIKSKLEQLLHYVQNLPADNKTSIIAAINNLLTRIAVPQQPFSHMDPNSLAHLPPNQQLNIILKWVRELSEADDTIPADIIKSKLKELLHYVQDLPAPAEEVIPIVEEIEPLLDLIDESREQQPQPKPELRQFQSLEAMTRALAADVENFANYIESFEYMYLTRTLNLFETTANNITTTTDSMAAGKQEFIKYIQQLQHLLILRGTEFEKQTGQMPRDMLAQQTEELQQLEPLEQNYSDVLTAVEQMVGRLGNQIQMFVNTANSAEFHEVKQTLDRYKLYLKTNKPISDEEKQRQSQIISKIDNLYIGLTDNANIYTNTGGEIMGAPFIPPNMSNINIPKSKKERVRGTKVAKAKTTKITKRAISRAPLETVASVAKPKTTKITKQVETVASVAPIKTGEIPQSTAVPRARLPTQQAIAQIVPPVQTQRVQVVQPPVVQTQQAIEQIVPPVQTQQAQIVQPPVVQTQQAQVVQPPVVQTQQSIKQIVPPVQTQQTQVVPPVVQPPPIVPPVQTQQTQPIVQPPPIVPPVQTQQTQPIVQPPPIVPPVQTQQAQVVPPQPMQTQPIVQQQIVPPVQPVVLPPPIVVPPVQTQQPQIRPRPIKQMMPRPALAGLADVEYGADESMEAETGGEASLISVGKMQRTIPMADPVDDTVPKPRGPPKVLIQGKKPMKTLVAAFGLGDLQLLGSNIVPPVPFNPPTITEQQAFQQFRMHNPVIKELEPAQLFPGDINEYIAALQQQATDLTPQNVRHSKNNPIVRSMQSMRELKAAKHITQDNWQKLVDDETSINNKIKTFQQSMKKYTKLRVFNKLEYKPEGGRMDKITGRIMNIDLLVRAHLHNLIYLWNAPALELHMSSIYDDINLLPDPGAQLFVPPDNNYIVVREPIIANYSEIKVTPRLSAAINNLVSKLDAYEKNLRNPKDVQHIDRLDAELKQAVAQFESTLKTLRVDVAEYIKTIKDAGIRYNALKDQVSGHVQDVDNYSKQLLAASNTELQLKRTIVQLEDQLKTCNDTLGGLHGTLGSDENNIQKKIGDLVSERDSLQQQLNDAQKQYAQQLDASARKALQDRENLIKQLDGAQKQAETERAALQKQFDDLKAQSTQQLGASARKAIEERDDLLKQLNVAKSMRNDQQALLADKTKALADADDKLYQANNELDQLAIQNKKYVEELQQLHNALEGIKRALQTYISTGVAPNELPFAKELTELIQLPNNNKALTDRIEELELDYELVHQELSNLTDELSNTQKIPIPQNVGEFEALRQLIAKIINKNNAGLLAVQQKTSNDQNSIADLTKRLFDAQTTIDALRKASNKKDQEYASLHTDYENLFTATEFERDEQTQLYNKTVDKLKQKTAELQKLLSNNQPSAAYKQLEAEYNKQLSENQQLAAEITKYKDLEDQYNGMRAEVAAQYAQVADLTQRQQTSRAQLIGLEKKLRASTDALALAGRTNDRILEENQRMVATLSQLREANDRNNKELENVTASIASFVSQNVPKGANANDLAGQLQAIQSKIRTLQQESFQLQAQNEQLGRQLTACRLNPPPDAGSPVAKYVQHFDKQQRMLAQKRP
jgi:chromosome segregation ATPase